MESMTGLASDSHRFWVHWAPGQNESCQIFHSPVSTVALLCRTVLNSFFLLSEPVLGVALVPVQHLPLRGWRWRKMKTCVLIKDLRANSSPTAFPGVSAACVQTALI